MRLTVILLVFLLWGTSAQVNPSANAATKTLWNHLKRLGSSDYIAFGQEFPTDFGQTEGLNSNYGTSDSKDVVGDHPAVHGSDFHYYLYKDASEANTHAGAVLAAHARGAIITFDFHMYDRSGDYKSNGGNSNLVANIVTPGTSDRTWFLGEMDKVIDIINTKLNRIPFVFRPLHEMTGDWFWWGSKNKKEDYKKLFQLMFDHFKSKGVNNLLWCWSPDKTLDWEFYPGDAYVDVIGMDVYEPGLVSYFSTEMLISVLSEMTDYAATHGKVAALTETGAREEHSIESNPTFWTSKILNPIKASPKARKIAWILTWINANWGGKPYIPYSGSSAAAKADFRTFYDDPSILFENDLAPFFGSPAPPPLPTPPPVPTPPPTPGPTPAPGGPCTDTPPPPAHYTCAQQAGWGKCGEAWMRGYCTLSCGRCPSCTNTPPPPGTYTCAQQVAWGKCSETWMQGYCNLDCGRCSASMPALPPPGTAPTPSVGPPPSSIPEDSTGPVDSQDPVDSGDSGNSEFPKWAIAIIVVGSVTVIASVALGVYFLTASSAAPEVV